jgi:hypothetical protein
MKASELPAGVDRSPQGLFAYLWGRVQTSLSRAIAIEPSPAFAAAVVDALARDEESEAFEGLVAVVPAIDAEELEAVGKILRIMRVIDDAFYQIHPRCVVPSASSAAAPLLPQWLEALAEARLASGIYHNAGSQQVIPRGPLRRASRDARDVYAETLAERFAALAVVPSHLDLRGAPIKLVFRVVGFDPVHGVPSGRATGKERVGFVPIAEGAADVVIQPQHRPEQGFLDYRLPPTINAADRLVTALATMGVLDVAIAPELVMREEHADEIPDRLIVEDKAACRIIVAGSGQTVATRHGQAWNESRIFNAQGTTLLRQRKLWPASIPQAKAAEYGVTDHGPSEMLLEDNARGDSIEVIDIDSFGRCVVLICQDFTDHSLTAKLVEHLQPDWIFVPILDAGIDTGRWAHQHAFAMSSESSARFLVCSSTALGQLIGKSPIECGMAVGAMRSTLGASGRQVHLCHADAGVTPAFSVIEWDRVVWKTSKLDAP